MRSASLRTEEACRSRRLARLVKRELSRHIRTHRAEVHAPNPQASGAVRLKSEQRCGFGSGGQGFRTARRLAQDTASGVHRGGRNSGALQERGIDRQDGAYHNVHATHRRPRSMVSQAHRDRPD